MRVTEACDAQQAPPGSAQETVARIAQQALEHTGCAGVHPARRWLIACSAHTCQHSS